MSARLSPLCLGVHGLGPLGGRQAEHFTEIDPDPIGSGNRHRALVACPRTEADLAFVDFAGEPHSHDRLRRCPGIACVKIDRGFCLSQLSVAGETINSKLSPVALVKSLLKCPSADRLLP